MADAADFVPAKKKSSDEAEKRKKLTPGSLMKALVRSGAGDANPSDGDQKEQWLIPHDLNMEEKGNILDLCLERVR